MPLNSSQQSAVASASPSDVEQFFRDLIPHFGSKQWLGTRNKYLIDCVGTLEIDSSAGSFATADLGQYIAASAPIHCADGWTYLGRALDAHCRGDFDTARHLAYYAELRAAMSFLATRGIGIFNDVHIVIGSGKQCSVFPAAHRSQGTHEITWYILEYWPTLAGSDQALLNVVSPQGVSLAQWVNEFHSSSVASSYLTRNWFRTWGLDLKRFAFDRESRNQASYRPTQYPKRMHITAKEISRFAYEIWRMFEPAASPFALLDDHLLRVSLQSAFRFRTGASHTSNSSLFEAEVARTIDTILSSTIEKASTKDFILEKSEPGVPRLLYHAMQTDNASNPRHHMQVISRASFLLRIASGFVERLINRSGVTNAHLEFWINEYIVRRGIWNDPGTAPNKWADLWADIGDALSEEEQWLTQNATTSPTIADWRGDRIESVGRFGEAERIVPWSWRL
jgi:hypothetical protein